MRTVRFLEGAHYWAPGVKRLPRGRITFDAYPAELRTRKIYERLGTVRDITIAALGLERALLRGRVSPRTVGEWETLIYAMLDAGWDGAEPIADWRRLRRRHRWLPHHTGYNEIDRTETWSEFVARLVGSRRDLH